MQHQQPEMTVSELLFGILYFGSIIGACWLVLWLVGALPYIH
jgi:hypothetical protein